MGIQPTQLIKLTERAINGYRHMYYNHTVDKAMFGHQIITGKSQDHLIVSYKPREDEDQKAQRINLYHARTKSAANRVMAVFDKIKQVEKKKERIVYTDDSDTKQDQINSLVSKYKGRKSLTKYLDIKYKFYNSVDANAWHIVGAMPEQDGLVRSYPIDIPSYSAYDYEYKMGELQYLITCEKKYLGEEEILEYYGFTAGLVLYAVEYNEDVEKMGYYPNSEMQDAPIDEVAEIEAEGKTYWVFLYETNTTETPAIRYGYMPDAETKEKTFVPVWDAAEEEFRDLINRKSEYDLTLALHTFLQRFQVAEPCDYADKSGKYEDICRSGRLAISGAVCPSCKGSGLKIHTTTQDIVLVKPSEDKESYIPLSEMARYLEMPFDIVKHQSEIIKELPREISVAIFGVDISKNPEGNVTATAIRNYYASVYAVLADYADHYSEMYKFIVHMSAQNAGIEQDLVAEHRFPRDFGLMSIEEMLVTLKSAKDAGASFQVIKNIERDILSKQLQDSPELIALEDIKDRYKPFKHLSQQEVLLELTSLPQDNLMRILYLYNDLIFQEIAQEQVAFLLMPVDRQKQIVEDKVQEIAERIMQQPEGIATIMDLEMEEEMGNEEEMEDGEQESTSEE